MKLNVMTLAMYYVTGCNLLSQGVIHSHIVIHFEAKHALKGQFA